MRRDDITDVQGPIIGPCMPQQQSGPGRTRHDDRRRRNGLLYGLKAGWTWGDVRPRVHSSPAPCWRRCRSWAADGIWEQLWRTLLSQLKAQGTLEWAQAFLDGSGVPAKQGALALATRRMAKAAT